MEKDTEGNLPKFLPGDRVYVLCNKRYATVIKQHKCYDGPIWFWGNVSLLYEDGLTGTSNSWQVEKV